MSSALAAFGDQHDLIGNVRTAGLQLLVGRLDRCRDVRHAAQARDVQRLAELAGVVGQLLQLAHLRGELQNRHLGVVRVKVEVLKDVLHKVQRLRVIAVRNTGRGVDQEHHVERALTNGRRVEKRVIVVAAVVAARSVATTLLRIVRSSVRSPPIEPIARMRATPFAFTPSRAATAAATAAAASRTTATIRTIPSRMVIQSSKNRVIVN